MLRNYLKTAWRNLLKNKFYSIINIAGLTAGLAIGILILLWVQDELSFDSFHKNAANIYRVEIWGGTGASRQIWQTGVAPIAQLAKQQLPGVKDFVRITGNYNFSLYKHKDKVFGDEPAVYANPSFFTVFDFPIKYGNPAKPFPNDNSMVITEKTAHKYFGNENPLGKVIVADNKVNFTVTGVIDDFPKNSQMNYDMIMPISYYFKDLQANHMDATNDFSVFNYENYLLLKPGTSLKSLANQLFNIHIKHKADDTDVSYLLLPLKKMHLYNADGTDRGIETVRLFVIIAFLILIIACINYVNLSTARSMLRSKEISMRKIVGAAKAQLFLQFIVETALLFMLAAVFALGLIYVLMPVFNQLSGKELVFNVADYHIWLVIMVTIAGTLVISSIYPALLLSSFEPLKALKGKISAGIGDVMFRKVLVVTQFVFSVTLIISTMVITNQLDFIRTKDLGYDKAHVFSFWMRDMGKHYNEVKTELLKQPGVIGVTRSNQYILSVGGVTGDTDWDGKVANQTFIVHPISIDKDFVSFFKMKMSDGFAFKGVPADSGHYILNETAIKEIGLKNPVGKRFRMQKISGTIIGVIKDFHYASMKEKIAPAVFYYNPNNFNRIYIKATTSEAPKAIAIAQAAFKQFNGEYPFQYTFLDEVFNSLYKGEQQEGTLFNYFALIAIFISCLGLLGLAAYTAQVRTREIGVRKVLGASVSGIIRLLAKDFIQLVLIAIVIASAVAWFTMNKWLEAFAYRTTIGWGIFVIAGVLAVIIAFITIALQSIKAALTNPVKSLRSE